MNQNFSANIAGVAGAMAMMGVSMASRKLGLSSGEMLVESIADSVAETAVEGAEEVADVNIDAGEGAEEAIGMGVHLGFAMSGAMLYSRVQNYLGLPAPAAGALFGLGLWAVNVAGVATMLGIRQTPWEENESRALTTILAHVAFGIVTALVYERLSEEN